MKNFVFMLLFPIFFLFSHNLKDIVDKIDTLFRSDSSHGFFEMNIKTSNWERTLKLEAWTKKMDETFIHILSPKKDKGICTLRKKHEMWNYFPKIDKIIKVPPSMMMGSWMGSDFTNDDLVRESSLLEDYKAFFYKEPKIEDELLYISLKPKTDVISLWGEIRLIVDAKNYIPKEQMYFDEHGEKIRVLYLYDVKKMGGKIIPTTLKMVPLTKKNHFTMIIYKEMEFNTKISDGVFSLRNLKKAR